MFSAQQDIYLDDDCDLEFADVDIDNQSTHHATTIPFEGPLDDVIDSELKHVGMIGFGKDGLFSDTTKTSRCSRRRVCRTILVSVLVNVVVVVAVIAGKESRRARTTAAGTGTTGADLFNATIPDSFSNETQDVATISAKEAEEILLNRFHSLDKQAPTHSPVKSFVLPWESFTCGATALLCSGDATAPSWVQGANSKTGDGVQDWAGMATALSW
jgi:hypothetical protein